MAPIHKVALAGASGSVAQALIPELLASGFDLTALVRPNSTSTLPASIPSIPVDYTDTAALTTALTGFDALISTVGSPAIHLQTYLIDACIAAGVRRFIPSEFGCDTENPRARALPVYGPKVQVAEYLEERTKCTQTTYTYIFNNAFLDWGIERKLLIDLHAKKMQLFDGGDRPWTATPLDFVAKGVVGVLKREEETRNRAVRLHGAKVTQRQLLEVARRVVGSEGWTVEEKGSEEMEKEAYENLRTEPGNVMGWVMGFLCRAIYGEGFGGDFEGENDNQLLGLKSLGEAEVEEVVRRCV
ncbi:uncharacterized protein LTR77_000240 [Saxophila tyrrhenica]|uniref:NmrA-like domain-containing protein n=1 Tax=Saxophila tyrrhenica TaxID=1690608 RepID=A0AAV9PRY7_9PEZI|nr:hypothetical protein LTR77_000240 [Saxophila tyrrhenica]